MTYTLPLYRYKLLFLIMGFCLSSCNDFEDVGLTPLVGDELEPISTSTTTSLPTIDGAYHIQTTSVNEIIQNEECVPSVNTSISEMDISPNVRLLIFDEEESDLVVFSPSANLLEDLPGIQSEARFSYGIDISPSQNWFIYKVFDSKRDGIAYYDHWISDVEGIVSWKLASDVSGGTSTDWVLENSIIFTGYLQHVNCPIMVKQVDPFSDVGQDIPVISTLIPYCILNQGFNPDGTQRLELGIDGFVINDFAAGQTKEVFPWFSDYYAEHGSATKIRFAWLESGVSIVVVRKDRIDFVFDLPTVPSEPYDVEVQRISFSDSGEILDGYEVLYSPEDYLIGLDILDDETWDYTDYENRPDTHFALLDLVEFEMTEYCLDRARFDNNSGIGSLISPTRLSPDKRFLAWTITELPYNHPSIYVAILDLHTGNIGYLQGPYELKGWVVDDN